MARSRTQALDVYSDLKTVYINHNPASVETPNLEPRTTNPEPNLNTNREARTKEE